MIARWAAAAFAAAALAAIALTATPALARSQDSSQAAPPMAADTDTVLVRTLPVNGLLLRPQQLQYAMRVISPDSMHFVGDREVTITQSSYGGFPAWLVVETRGGGVPSMDTLYLSSVDLRPLHWSSTIGGARMAIEFTADSMYGATTSPAGNQNIVQAHGHDLLAGSAMTEAVLQVMPHAVGRVDSVSVLTVDLGSARILAGVLSVDGEQDLDTPAGREHCWVITLTTAVGSVRYWVTEAQPVVIQTRQAMPGRPGIEFEQTLVSRR